jgi:AcrR family transcriptional regulator
MSARRKTRDAARTRSALIDAARWLLTRKGYDQVGIREIASRAGVDSALVQRYFGSKKNLFEESVRGEFDVTPLLADTNSGPLAERLANILLQPTKDRAEYDPALVILRSAANHEARKPIAVGLQREFLDHLARELGGDEGSNARAASALAVLVGFDMLQRILGVALFDKAEARRLLVRLIDVCVAD